MDFAVPIRYSSLLNGTINGKCDGGHARHRWDERPTSNLEDEKEKKEEKKTAVNGRMDPCLRSYTTHTSIWVLCTVTGQQFFFTMDTFIRSEMTFSISTLDNWRQLVTIKKNNNNKIDDFC